MCRETEVDRHLGDTDIGTLTSVQPPTVKERLSTRSSKPPNQLVLSSTISDKEEQQRVVNEREVIRPVFPRRTSAPSARLLPYFPKPGVTSPPPPQSLARNPDPALPAAVQAPISPPSKSIVRNPSPGPSSRGSNASTKHSANSVQSPSLSSRATARNPSPTPTPRFTARNPSASNPSPATTTASRSTARNPSPSPAPRIVSRNPSPTPAPRVSARNPSPNTASRTSARNPSPGPASSATSGSVSTKPHTAAALIVNSLVPSTNGRIITSGRRSASPALIRKDPSRPVSNDNGSRVSTMEANGKTSMLASPPNGLMDVNKTLNRSLTKSLRKDGSPECPTYIPVKKLTPGELQAQKKERISGYGRKAGTHKSGRVACEGMLPNSPVKTDTRKRCHWVTPQSELELISYHDEDWGVPVHDDKLLFELLVLEGAQSELSRPQILSMRDYFRSSDLSESYKHVLLTILELV